MDSQQYTVARKTSSLMPGRETGTFILALTTAAAAAYSGPIVSSAVVPFYTFNRVDVGDTVWLNVAVTVSIEEEEA